MSEWEDELDGAAIAMLNARGLAEYRKYKARLLSDGTPNNEVEEILRGFILDASETGSDLASE